MSISIADVDLRDVWLEFERFPTRAVDLEVDI
jgi:hypothetical protein